MFMFSGCRKRQVIKRLLKLARERLERESLLANRENERHRNGPTEEEAEETVLRGVSHDQLLSLASTLLKRLNESELTALLRSVEAEGRLDGVTSGGESESCLLVNASLVLRLKGTLVKIDPRILTLRLFRGVNAPDQLRVLPMCRQCDSKVTSSVNETTSTSVTVGDLQIVCCNPYHVSKVWAPDPRLGECIYSSWKLETD